jgi:hypothetical protein
MLGAASMPWGCPSQGRPEKKHYAIVQRSMFPLDSPDEVLATADLTFEIGCALELTDKKFVINALNIPWLSLSLFDLGKIGHLTLGGSAGLSTRWEVRMDMDIQRGVDNGHFKYRDEMNYTISLYKIIEATVDIGFGPPSIYGPIEIPGVPGSMNVITETIDEHEEGEEVRDSTYSDWCCRCDYNAAHPPPPQHISFIFLEP